MKRVCVLLFVVIALICFGSVASAASYSVYGDISYNSSQAMNLYSYYMNSDNFNPFYEYQIARVSQYEYLLFYSTGSELHYIVYNTNGQYNGQAFVEYTTDSFYLSNPENYTYISNLSDPNAIRSSTIETFNFQYIVSYLLPIGAVLLIFFLFKPKFNPYRKGYDV